MLTSGSVHEAASAVELYRSVVVAWLCSQESQLNFAWLDNLYRPRKSRQPSVVVLLLRHLPLF